MSIVPVLIAAQATQKRDAERALLDAFRVADATAPDRAQSLSRLALARSDAFAQLEAAGVVRAVGRDRYYLDETAVVARRASAARRSTLPRGLILVIGLLLLVGLAALGVLARAN